VFNGVGAEEKAIPQLKVGSSMNGTAHHLIRDPLPGVGANLLIDLAEAGSSDWVYLEGFIHWVWSQGHSHAGMS
jgi:hypothetical protein